MISKNQIKHIQALHSKKNREETGLFIIEGVKLIEEFLSQTKFEVSDVFASEEFIKKHKSTFSNKSIRFFEVNDDELKKISLQSTPNKALAIVRQKQDNLNENILQSSVNLFLDDIRDPGNLGTIIRIADWFGIGQIICSPNCTELYNPKVLQASMGAIIRMPVVYMNFEDLKPFLQSVPKYGAVLTGQNIYTSKLSSGIIIIGNEANGISQEVISEITHPITIPSAQSNGSESLNAANACAIICSEFHRQLTY